MKVLCRFACDPSASALASWERGEDGSPVAAESHFPPRWQLSYIGQANYHRWLRLCSHCVTHFVFLSHRHSQTVVDIISAVLADFCSWELAWRRENFFPTLSRECRAVNSRRRDSSSEGSKKTFVFPLSLAKFSLFIVLAGGNSSPKVSSSTSELWDEKVRAGLVGI